MLYCKRFRKNDLSVNANGTVNGGDQIEFNAVPSRAFFGLDQEVDSRTVIFTYNPLPGNPVQEERIFEVPLSRSSARGDFKIFDNANFKNFVVNELGVTYSEENPRYFIIDEDDSRFGHYDFYCLPENTDFKVFYNLIARNKQEHMLISRNDKPRLHFNLTDQVIPIRAVRYNFTTQYKQKIRYGAPGTGKSFSMQNESNVIRVTFHPDTDYSSFVGCYKPRTKDGKVIYDFVPQAFLQAYTKAWCDPQHEYMLVVEEINRGNCAQIFGDLFQLLDRDDEGYSRYPIVCDTDMWEIYLKTHLPINYIADGLEAHYRNAEHAGESFTGEGKMALPPNLSICATMNTSDQSLYKMDSAFKRRWLTEYVPIRYKAKRVDGNPIDGDTGLAKLEDVKLDFYQEKPWLEILYAINSFIRNRLNSTSKQMGQWFIVPEKDGEGFANIKFEIFRDKLMFYLFNDAFKKSDNLNQPFGKEDDGFLFLFEDLCLERDGGKELCKTFIDNLVNEFPYPNE